MSVHLRRGVLIAALLLAVLLTHALQAQAQRVPISPLAPASAGGGHNTHIDSPLVSPFHSPLFIDPATDSTFQWTAERAIAHLAAQLGKPLNEFVINGADRNTLLHLRLEYDRIAVSHIESAQATWMGSGEHDVAVNTRTGEIGPDIASLWAADTAAYSAYLLQFVPFTPELHKQLAIAADTDLFPVIIVPVAPPGMRTPDELRAEAVRIAPAPRKASTIERTYVELLEAEAEKANAPLVAWLGRQGIEGQKLGGGFAAVAATLTAAQLRLAAEQSFVGAIHSNDPIVGAPGGNAP